MKTRIERGTRYSSDTALDSKLCDNWVIICNLGVIQLPSNIPEECATLLNEGCAFYTYVEVAL